MANILDEGTGPILDEAAGFVTDEAGPEPPPAAIYGTARQGIMTIPRAVAGTWP